MRYQWWIHGHINFVLLSSSAFCDLYDKVMEPEEPTEAYRMLQGFPTTSVDAGRGPVGAQPHGPGQPDAARSCSRPRTATELLAALDESEEGRDFRRQLDEFLFEYGWRHDAVYDLADVPWREDPSIPLGQHPGDDGARPRARTPSSSTRQNVAAREELFAKLREQLADDPDTMAKLDELYEAARYSFPLTEDHAFYIDQLYISVFRRFVLAVGDRLVGQGRLRPARRRLLPLPRRGRRRAQQRRRPAGRWWPSGGPASSGPARSTPPTALGTPPPPPEVPDPFMDALVYRLLGHGAAGGEPRPQRAQGASPAHRASTPARPGWCARWPRPPTTSRRARSWSSR